MAVQFPDDVTGGHSAATWREVIGGKIAVCFYEPADNGEPVGYYVGTIDEWRSLFAEIEQAATTQQR